MDKGKQPQSAHKSENSGNTSNYLVKEETKAGDYTKKTDSNIIQADFEIYMLFPADEAAKKLYRAFTTHLTPWFTFMSIQIKNREAQLLVRCNGMLTEHKKYRLAEAITNMSKLVVHFGPPTTSLWARLKKCCKFDDAVHSIIDWDYMKNSELRVRHSFELNTGLVNAYKELETKRAIEKKDAGMNTIMQNISTKFEAFVVDKQETKIRSIKGSAESLK